MAKFLVYLRWFALVALVIALLLIWARWRHPRQPGQNPGLLEEWRAAWQAWTRRRARESEQNRSLRALRGRTILLADPDDRAARVMIWKLESLGCRVARAGSGRSAIRLLDSTRPHAVIADTLLPDISAAQFYEHIGGSVSAIMFVGVLPEQWEPLSELGPNVRCFAKPYDPDEVAAKTGAMLRRSGGSREESHS